MKEKKKKKIIVIFASSYTWPRGQWCSGQQGSDSIFRLQLGSRTNVKAGTCCKTASRAPLRAKVVNFCPDSLEPVQAMEDYLSNSSRTAAGMGCTLSYLQQIGTVESLAGCIINSGNKESCYKQEKCFTC